MVLPPPRRRRPRPEQFRPPGPGLRRGGYASDRYSPGQPGKPIDAYQQFNRLISAGTVAPTRRPATHRAVSRPGPPPRPPDAGGAPGGSGEAAADADSS